MKKSVATALFLSPAMILGFISLFWIYGLNPYLKNWILTKIPEINTAQPYVILTVKNIDFSILKLQAKVTDLSVEFKKDSPQNFGLLKKIDLKQAKIQLDLFSLMVGQFSFSNLTLDGLETNQRTSALLKLKSDNQSATKEILLHDFFKAIDGIPLQKIIIQNTNIKIDVNESENKTLRQIQARIPNLFISQNHKSISIVTHDLVIQLTNQRQASTELKLLLNAKFDEKTYAIEQFRIQHGSSEIVASSFSKDLPQLLINPETETQFDIRLKLDELKELIYQIKEQSQRLPQIAGFIKLTGKISTTGLKKNSGQFKLSTEEVHFENLKFGNARATAKIKDSHFLIDSILVEHPSGQAELKQISLQQEKPYAFKADLVVQDFHLQKLFKSLNLNDIPADLKATAKAQCSGQIENLKVHCDSQIMANSISVQTELNDPFYIVQIDQAEALSESDLTLNGLNFKTNLRIGKSTVQSSGNVNFENGFEMKFNTKSLDLSEIKNIANLGLKGTASGELTTNGDTSFGIIDSNLLINNFVIDHFALGQLQTHLKYAKAKLSFLNNLAKLNKSNYTGDVELDFSKSQIQGQLKLNPLFLNDVLFAIEDRWHLPMTAGGKGTAEIQFNGPLDFWQMSYNLKSEFQRGQIMNETFIKLNADLQSDGEKINFKNVTLLKPHGSLRVTNDILTTPAKETPRLNLQIKSTGLRIEDIDHFSDLFPTANGQLNINGTVSSNILTPKVLLQVQTKDLKIDNTSLPTSQGDVELTLDHFKYLGQIFGRQLQLDLTIPMKDKEKFYIKAQARDLNPLILLPMLSLPLPPSDTYASISGDLELKSDNAAFKNLTGEITVENILLQRSSQTLKLKKPGLITFNHGLEKMDPLILSGPDQNMTVALKNGSNSELQIDGRIFLRPLQFLVPFLDNLSGLAEVSCLVDLKSQKLNFSGEGLIDNASVTMKGFKYPINDISTYFDFSKSKIIFSELNATLNQTAITGQGQVDIKGSKNIDVLLTAETDKMDLEFPPKYQTSGIAQLKFYGQWLPYNLKIDYAIDEGNITKEFTEDDENAVFSLRPSPFLPEQQLNQKNQSLLLDVTADFSKGVTVKNRIVDGIALGKIHVTGSPENPILQGRVDIQQGSRLFFKDKPFDIQLGSITFGGEYVINPIIFMNANARVSDYDINLQIQGPAKSLDIQPTSQPSLSREDIFSLLALGYTASKNDQVLSSDIQQKQTGLEVLAALSNQSELNKKLQQKLGLNVQLSPSIDSTRNIAVPKVTVSKKLSSKVTTSYSRPLTGDQQENEVRMQYLWSKDISLILNYQNQGADQQTNILQNNKNDTGIGGIDLEFKKEFGE